MAFDFATFSANNVDTYPTPQQFADFRTDEKAILLRSIVADRDFLTETDAEMIEVYESLGFKATTPAVIEEKPTPKPIPVVKDTRTAATTNFSAEEIEYINPTLKARMAENSTNTMSHFMRQCVDLVMNSDYIVINGIQVEFNTGSNANRQKKALKGCITEKIIEQFPELREKIKYCK